MCWRNVFYESEISVIGIPYEECEYFCVLAFKAKKDKLFIIVICICNFCLWIPEMGNGGGKEGEEREECKVKEREEGSPLW